MIAKTLKAVETDSLGVQPAEGVSAQGGRSNPGFRIAKPNNMPRSISRHQLARTETSIAHVRHYACNCLPGGESMVHKAQGKAPARSLLQGTRGMLLPLPCLTLFRRMTFANSIWSTSRSAMLRSSSSATSPLALDSCSRKSAG